MPSLKQIFGFIKSARNSQNKSPAHIDEDQLLREFEKKLHVHFHNTDLLITALKHRSFLNITGEDRTQSNERLEFLGDAVLNLVVTHHLYERFPTKTEGQLSKMKSILVSKAVLADIANRHSIGEMVLINWGEEKTGGRRRQSILADAFEAIVGAIYLDQGLDKAREFIQKYLLKEMNRILRQGLYRNYKSILLEFVQSEGLGLPEYRVVEELGPDHAKEFVIEVIVANQKWGEGRGKSKKVAEQEAARQALERMNITDRFLD